MGGRRVSATDRAALALLAVAMLVVAGLCLHLTRGMTFWYDDWNFAMDRRGWTADAFLAPHNEHLMAPTAALYKALFLTSGADYAPYRVVVTLAHLLVVALVVVYLRGRVGTIRAVAAGLLVLCLGAGYEVILWPVSTGFLASLAALAGALLALDRGDRAGDAAAAAALTLALASSSLGIAIFAGVAVELLLRPDRRARWWILAAPALLYVAWRVGYHPPSPGWADSAGQVLSYGADSAAAALGGLLALGGEWGRVLAVAAVALVVRALLAPARRTPRALGLLTIALAFWGLTAIARAPLGEPGASRYVYVGAVLALLAGGELARGWRPPRVRETVLLALLVALVAPAGLLKLREGGRMYRANTRTVAIELGAAQLARGVAPPTAQPDPELAPQLTLAAYFALADDLGPVGWSVGELRAGSVRDRQLADAALARLYALAPRAAAGDDCAAPAALRGAVALAPGTVIRLRSQGGGVVLRRFAPGFSAPPIGLAPGVWRLAVARDRAPDAWHVAARPEGSVARCRPPR